MNYTISPFVFSKPQTAQVPTHQNHKVYIFNYTLIICITMYFEST